MSSPITSISITDVRTFSGIHHAELSRINLLIGNNSVGKSTFMGCLNAIGQMARLTDLDDHTNVFDREPFCMGSFNSIVREGSQSFRVEIGMGQGIFRKFGIDFTGSNSNIPNIEIGLQMLMREKVSKIPPNLSITREISSDHPQHWRFKGPEFQFLLDQSQVSYSQFTSWLSRSVRYGYLPFSGDPSRYMKRAGDPTPKELAAFTKFVNFFHHYFHSSVQSTPITPIIPHMLKRKRQYSVNPIESLCDDVDLSEINRLGRKVGLFNDILVNKYSDDHFEVLVKISDSYHNLIDVGYGVISLLPLIAALSQDSLESLFLLQQPEVHVHPSAQSELIKMIAQSNHAFIIETHSDHIIAWLRILVKEKVIEPSEVAIIFFEQLGKSNPSTCLHQITLDHRANLIGQPPNYREFFMNETSRLLGLVA